jgi:hypothetical protein
VASVLPDLCSNYLTHQHITCARQAEVYNADPFAGGSLQPTHQSHFRCDGTSAVLVDIKDPDIQQIGLWRDPANHSLGRHDPAIALNGSENRVYGAAICNSKPHNAPVEQRNIGSLANLQTVKVLVEGALVKLFNSQP